MSARWSHGAYAYKMGYCTCDICRGARAAERKRSRERHLEADRERRRSYRLTCPDCGGEMSGGNGKAKDPKRCLACERARIAAQHGTRSKYQAGCRCDECTRANREGSRLHRQRQKAAA